MAEENTAQSANSQGEQASAAPKAKKEKPPKVEDKPFQEFMEQHFMPALNDALKSDGWDYVELSLINSPLAVKGADRQESFWQLRGEQKGEVDRHFSIVFTKEDITSPKYFYYSQGDGLSSTIEQFMGDERRITLDLMVLYTLQRLTGQKWLTRN